MLSTSMGSCLRARRRKALRSVFLKLSLRCLVVIVISEDFSKANRVAVSNHKAVVGFFRAT